MAPGKRRRRRGRAAEHTQVPGSDKGQCSNHYAMQNPVVSAEEKFSEPWTTGITDCSKARLTKELGMQDVVQIACGDQHAIALSRGGELFTWGHNTHGQLGVGIKGTVIPQPQLLETLKGISLAHIAAGGAHSAVVSLSGAVWSWGKNDFGQLGLGDTEDRDCPSYVAALEHWKAVFISCGSYHTAVLSKGDGEWEPWGKEVQFNSQYLEKKHIIAYLELQEDGLVCTFGAGEAGQLGHNSTRNELRPRVVAELWGARVSQVACGRQHTLVYVPSLDRVYSFGSGEGQLGEERKLNRLIPLPINSPVNTGKSCQKNKKSQKVVTAGGNPSLALFQENKKSCFDGIATLKAKDVGTWISNSSSQAWESIRKTIRLIFSSEACINGSFLEKRDKHFKTSKEASGVDLSEVQRFYKMISKKPKVFQEVKQAIEKLLLSLSSSPISPENFRVYLILPFLLQGRDDSSYCSVRLLAQAIMKLQPKDLGTLECLWSNLETSFFSQLVTLYQRVSQQTLSPVVTELKCGLRKPLILHPHETVTLPILQRLYQVNSRTGSRVQENNFYVPQVKAIISCCWFFNVEETALWELTKYPCIFDIQDKIIIHQIERRALCRHHTHVLLMLVVQEHWFFPVRRQYLLQDIWRNLSEVAGEQFRKTLKVSFVGQPAEDMGGPCRELFSAAAEALCQPGTGAFVHLASGLVWFPSQAPSCEVTFSRIGTLCGMALYNGCPVPFPFPRALYKKLLGLAPTLEDLEELSPVEGRSLQKILDEERDDVLDSMDMFFTTMEEGESMAPIELKENGANIPVTRDNKKEFVDLYLDYMFHKSIRKPFKAFMKGFLRGCPTKKWKMFLPAELQIVLQGHTKIDWLLLEKNTVYLHYDKSDQTIRDFWTVFRGLPEEKKRKFLAFLSGSDRISGFGQEHFKFSIADPQEVSPDEFYPFANTCSRILFLPRYSSRRILRKKLLEAIECNKNFGLP